MNNAAAVYTLLILSFVSLILAVSVLLTSPTDSTDSLLGYTSTGYTSAGPSLFPFTNAQLSKFESVIQQQLSPNDCAINAMQLIGILDYVSANILRISCVGKSGMQKSEIEGIFDLAMGKQVATINSPSVGKYFSFEQSNNYEEFSQVIKQAIKPSTVIFCGETFPQGGKHVFLIGQTLDNKIMYIDPQQNVICDLALCENTYIRNRSNWFILCNSKENLREDTKIALGFRS